MMKLMMEDGGQDQTPELLAPLESSDGLLELNHPPEGAWS